MSTKISSFSFEKVLQVGLSIYLSVVNTIKNPVVIALLVFSLFSIILYCFDSENDVVKVFGVMANITIAGAVFLIQYVHHGRDTEEKRRKEIKDISMNFITQFMLNEKPDLMGNMLVGSGDDGIDTVFSATKKRYLVYWKFEYIKSLERCILVVTVRRLYGKTGKSYYGSTITTVTEGIGGIGSIKPYRNSSSSDISEEKGRKTVSFRDFGDKEWDTYMHIMPGVLTEHFKQKYAKLK